MTDIAAPANPYAAPKSAEAVSAALGTPRRAFFHWAFLLAIIIWAAVGITIAWRDRSWGAFGIAVIYGPVGNASLAVLAAFYGAARKFRIGIPLVIVVAGAVASCIVTFSVIFAMDLHGC